MTRTIRLVAGATLALATLFSLALSTPALAAGVSSPHPAAALVAHRVTRVCPHGGQHRGRYCVIVTHYAAVRSTVTYACPLGATLSGHDCVELGTTPASPVPGVAPYSCPTGDVLQGTECASTTTTSTSSSSDGQYTCNPGDTLNGETCTVANATYPATSTTQYSCNPGDTVNTNDGVCTHSTPATSGSSYTCPSGDVVINGDECAYTLPEDQAPDCMGTIAGYANPPTDSIAYCETGAATPSDSGTGTCPSGGTYDAITNDCISTYQATATTQYACNPGDTLSGQTCTAANATYPAIPSTSGSCPTGTTEGSTSGTCVSGATVPATPNPNAYTCPAGSTLSGSSCLGIESTPATKMTSSTARYTCPRGGRLVKTTCVVTRRYTAA